MLSVDGRAESTAGQRVERLVQEDCRDQRGGQDDRDQRQLIGEEEVVVRGPQGRLPNHRDNGRPDQQDIAQHRGPGEHTSAQALPPNPWFGGLLLVRGEDEPEVLDHLEEVVKIQRRVVRPLIPRGHLGNRQTGVEHPQGFRALGREQRVGTDVRATDHDAVVLSNHREPVQADSTDARCRHTHTPPRLS